MKEMTYDQNSVGGVVYLYAIPYSALTAIVKNHVSGFHSITVNMTNVVKLDCCGAENFSFNEVHERDEHGDYWNVTIQAVVLKASFENSITIEQLERGEWVVVSKDQNGILRVSGDKDTMLNCSSDATSGAAHVDANHTVLTFSGKLGHPSWLIDNDL